jgi:pimeloyl-ACP methyl ester carboxylesterase
LFGISYGTRLALTALRDFPQGIRSVILDSTYPPETDLLTNTPANAERAFTQLFDGCAADPACNAAYPNLRVVFYELVTRLNERPVQGFGASGVGTMRLTLTGDALLVALHSALYNSEMIRSLPLAIYAAQSGDYKYWFNTLAIIDAEGAGKSEGMFLSVECSEEVPFADLTAVAAADARYPEQRHMLAQSGMVASCKQWGVPQAAAVENEPVHSTIPALILAGQYDPVTPPADGQTTAQALSGAFYFEFPGLGHAVSLTHPCVTTIMLDFLNQPTTRPPAACLAQMKGPQFVITGQERR